MVTHGQTMVIDRFRGEHEFLSNFSDYSAEYAGVWFPTAEHAFAAAKTTDPRWVGRIEAAATPGEAKKLGRQLPRRPEWDRVKPAVMAEILRDKFTRDPRLRELLVSTADQLLIEGNHWDDAYWGRCLRPGLVAPAGANMLGRTLMQVRGELRGDPADRWPRAALTGHREHLISPDAHPWVRAELERIVVKLRDHHGTHTASSGLATGADTWFGKAAFAAGLDVWGYQPFPTQNAPWTETQKADHASICERLARLVLVADHADKRFFDVRNQLLIGDAQVVVTVRDSRITRGGTVSALRRYCYGMPVITVDLARRTTTITTDYRP
ncbi:NADAR family protein [Nocardia abscessus]|uniref:NADAR family protein n=1 Tax=Nocardia abscessus TaxID=120957 RepID=UPI0024554577|nr:NADAR family protein [Nocardia abscessus]